MSLDAFPLRSSEAETYQTEIRLLGTGADVPTKELGKGITVARTGTGVYTLTWADNPGTFLGWSPGLGAATPADVAGYTVVRDTYASKVLAISLFDATAAAVDLAADEYLDISVRFSRG